MWNDVCNQRTTKERKREELKKKYCCKSKQGFDSEDLKFQLLIHSHIHSQILFGKKMLYSHDLNAMSLFSDWWRH